MEEHVIDFFANKPQNKYYITNVGQCHNEWIEIKD